MTLPASLDLQGLIYRTLRADSDLTALIGDRVFDFVPQDEKAARKPLYPMVTIGEGDEVADDADCVRAVDVEIVIHCWSREPGLREVKQVADAVRRALHDRDDLALTDNGLVLLQHRQTTTMREDDGITSHAALRFNALIEQG